MCLCTDVRVQFDQSSKINSVFFSLNIDCSLSGWKRAFQVSENSSSSSSSSFQSSGMSFLCTVWNNFKQTALHLSAFEGARAQWLPGAPEHGQPSLRSCWSQRSGRGGCSKRSDWKHGVRVNIFFFEGGSFPAHLEDEDASRSESCFPLLGVLFCTSEHMPAIRCLLGGSCFRLWNSRMVSC